MINTNMKIETVAGVFLLVIIFTACKKDYLEYDYNIDGTLSKEEIFSSDRHARGFLNTVYLGLGTNTATTRFELNSELGLAAGSDEAVSANLSSHINILTNGSWGPTNTYDVMYSDSYRNLRRANLFLENAPTSAIAPATDVRALMGEALFLRAFFHFELLKRYGGIILATRSFSLEDNLNLPRSTFDETVAQIVKDCDTAAATISDVTLTQQLSTNKGRATKAAALALKARTLLYAASPLHSTANDISKWQAAALAAKAVIDISGTNHGLLTVAQLPTLWNFSQLPYNREVIFAAQTVNVNSIDQSNAPPGYDGGGGRTNPTQELVNAFEMKATGRPISEGAISGYRPTDPYTGRDDRLRLFINYHGNTWRGVAIDVSEGGKDNNPQNDVNRTTRTGYYLRKYLSESSRYSTGGTTTTRRAWVYFRYAEVLLNYAEALNETLAAPSPEVFASINLVRQRVGLPALQSTNPNGNGYVPNNRDAMRARIQNERRVELCFEDHRFFDVRRWKKGEELFNQPVTGMRITKNGTALTYTPFVVENRIFSARMYLFPFPTAETNVATELVQNPGW